MSIAIIIILLYLLIPCVLTLIEFARCGYTRIQDLLLLFLWPVLLPKILIDWIRTERIMKSLEEDEHE